MPRVDTTATRRAKRDAQQRTSLAGLPISSSARATASLTTPASTGSISAPVKLEPARAAIAPAASPTIIIPAKAQTWRHPDELLFIKDAGNTWDDMTLIRFLRANALTIPPRPASTADPWVVVRCADGSEVTLPRGYRIPLLWVVKFLWSSIPIILGANEWDYQKFDLLHVARLIATLIAGARAAIDGGGIDRGWRCAPFDRALRRYWHKWFVMRDEFVRDFWREFEEEEFEGDVLKLGWGTWVLRGHKGFVLTKDEVANGISAAEFMKGFIVDEQKGTFHWVDDSSESPAAEVQVEPQQTLPVKAHLPIPGQTPETQSTAPKKPSPPVSTSSKSKSFTAAPAVRPQPRRKQKSLPIPIPAQVPSSAQSAAADIPPVQPPMRMSPPMPVQAPIPIQVPVLLPAAKSGLAADTPPTPVPVRGSVSLAALVSRIPLGGGRHRSHGTQVETAASRSRRLSQVSDVEMREESQITAPKRKSSITPAAQPQAQPLPLRKDSWPKEAAVPMVVDPSEQQHVPLFPSEQSRTPFEQSNRPASRGADHDVEMRDAPPVSEISNVVPPVKAIGNLAVVQGQGQVKLATVCAPYRGHPTDVFKRLLHEKAGSKERDQEQETETEAAGRLNTPVDTSQQEQQTRMEMEEEEEEEEEEEGAPEEIKTEAVNMKGIEGSVLEDDLDLDEDLQLLYPESPLKLRTPGHASGSITGSASSPEPSHSQSHSRSRSSSKSSSSPSPTSPVAPMSSARFPSEGPSAPSAPPSTSTLFTPASASTSNETPSVPASTSTVFTSASISTSFQLAPPSASYQLASTSSSYQLTVPASTSGLQLSPRHALAELAAEPNLLARLTQTWGELRAEVGALRAEIRSAPNRTAELEERIRRLEEGSSQSRPASVSVSFQSNAAAAPRWHPLQHLISGDEDVQMDVDAPSAPEMAGDGVRTTKYAGADNKEPLPPRSRKFSSAVRVAVV